MPTFCILCAKEYTSSTLLDLTNIRYVSRYIETKWLSYWWVANLTYSPPHLEPPSSGEQWDACSWSPPPPPSPSLPIPCHFCHQIPSITISFTWTLHGVRQGAEPSRPNSCLITTRSKSLVSARLTYCRCGLSATTELLREPPLAPP